MEKKPYQSPVQLPPIHCVRKKTQKAQKREHYVSVLSIHEPCAFLSHVPLRNVRRPCVLDDDVTQFFVFFSPLTRENPFFIIMHLPFQHPLALTCQFKRTSIPLLVAPFPLHCNSAQNSHMCWLESCYQITGREKKSESIEGGKKHFYLGLNPSVRQRGFKGFLYPRFIIAISHSKTCFAEISPDQSGFHRDDFKVSIGGKKKYYCKNGNTLISWQQFTSCTAKSIFRTD